MWGEKMKFTKIKDNDVANGMGITMSLWTQGCPHHCKGCFNEETWNYDGGEEFNSENLQYVLDNIDKNGIKRNLAVLGGEPLCPQNVDGVLELCKKFKEAYPEKKIYLWSGYIYDEFNDKQRDTLEYIDILVDGQFQIENRNLSLILRGSSNQRIIEVKKSLENNILVLSSLNS